MNPLDTDFHRRLLKRIEAESQTWVEGITSGNLDRDEYKRRCGYLKALADAVIWCAEIESAMNQGK